MKKITQSFLATAVSSIVICQSFIIQINGEEINVAQNLSTSKSISINSDEEVNPHAINKYNMGNKDSFSSLPKSARNNPTTFNPLRNSYAIGSGKVSNTDTLNIRSGPATSYKIIGKLNKGDSVEILEKSRNWYKISYNNEYGYIYYSYVTLNPIEKGLDVSKWNNDLDWTKIKNDGFDYVIIRAGSSYNPSTKRYDSPTEDSMFKKHISGATKAGLKVGVYYFSYAASVPEAEKEAEEYLNIIKPYKDSISYPVFFDYEYHSKEIALSKKDIEVTKNLVTDMADAFLNKIESNGYISGIYTNRDFGDKHFTEDILYNNNLWVAQYSSNCTYPRPYNMWQFTETGKINGVSGNFDMNYTYLKFSVPNSSNNNNNNNNNLSSASIEEINSQKYTGSEVKPTVKVTLNDRTLKENEDYTLTYSDNISVGTGKITINGINGYTGTKTISFKIIPQDVSLTSVNDIKSVTYTGSDIKPSVTLTLNDKTLKENEDYTLTYSDNIPVGTGKITITGINGYTGTKTVSFKIIPKTVSNVLSTNKTSSSISFSWNKIDDVTGYKIYKYDESSKSYKHLKTIKDNTINTYTDSKLNSSSTYNYKIRAYKVIDETTYYGKYSSIFTDSTEALIKVNKVTNLKLDDRKTNSLKISWNKIDNVTGYKVYRYDTNTETYKLIKTISDASTTYYTNTNLSSATRYLYKVKSYKIVNSKTYNSDFSSSLLATTKPLTPSVTLTIPSTKSIKLTLSNTSSRTTGYKIYMSTSKNGTYSYIGYTNSKTFTKTKLTKNKTYYFKVRAYRTVNNSNVYSSYSSIKSIKCK
ncbi:GH25 family lysozyme [Terrisporobacter sp.]